MKFELKGEANKNQAVTGDRYSVMVEDCNIAKYCTNISFNISTKDQIPVVTFEIMPTEKVHVCENGEVYFILDGKKFKCTEVTEEY